MGSPAMAQSPRRSTTRPGSGSRRTCAKLRARSPRRWKGEAPSSSSGRTRRSLNPEMTSEALVDLLQQLESAGIEVWLDGGWAVDAVLGAQTRPHKDVDIILRVTDLLKLGELLGSRGCERRPGRAE